MKITGYKNRVIVAGNDGYNVSVGYELDKKIAGCHAESNTLLMSRKAAAQTFFSSNARSTKDTSKCAAVLCGMALSEAVLRIA